MEKIIWICQIPVYEFFDALSYYTRIRPIKAVKKDGASGGIVWS